MKKICLLIYSLRAGGAERVICQWSELLSNDYDVYLTVFDAIDVPAYSHCEKIVCLHVPSNNKNAFTKTLIVLKRMLRLLSFVKKNRFDMVLSFCNECNLVNTFSIHRAKKVCSIRSVSDLGANRFVKYVIMSKKTK